MKIAACLIVKDEADDIAEWLAFHGTMGFDALLVYDNGSSDATIDVLRSASKLLDVRIIDWPSGAGRAQVQAYDDAARRFRSEFDWIAFIDSDEFLVIHPPHTLRSLCSAPDAAAIGINWAMFGSNDHVERPSKLVIEAFTRRAVPWFGPNQHVKSLVRTRAAVGCINPHAFSVAGPTVRADGSALAWAETPDGPQAGITAAAPDFGIAQINHYFTRSRAHWAAKTRRGYPNPLSRVKLGMFDVYDRNEVEDRSALRRVVSVRALRNRIMDGVASQGAPAAIPHILGSGSREEQLVAVSR